MQQGRRDLVMAPRGWRGVAAMLILGFVLVGTAGADGPATLFKSLEVQASLVKFPAVKPLREHGESPPLCA